MNEKVISKLCIQNRLSRRRSPTQRNVALAGIEFELPLNLFYA